jgi:hypothetical protein
MVSTEIFRDGAERHLSHLRATAHDDDAFAVDVRKRRRLLDANHTAHGGDLAQQRVDRGVGGALDIDLRLRFDNVDVNVADVRALVGKHFRETKQHPGLVHQRRQNRVGSHHACDL